MEVREQDLQLQSLMEANHGTRPVDLPLAEQSTKHAQFLYIDKESLQSVNTSMFAELQDDQYGSSSYKVPGTKSYLDS